MQILHLCKIKLCKESIWFYWPQLEIDKNAFYLQAVCIRGNKVIYAMANINYIQNTQCKDASKHFNTAEAKQWAKQVKWIKLEIISAVDPVIGQLTATVHFKAYYIQNDELQCLEENSVFDKINNQWLYTNSIK